MKIFQMITGVVLSFIGTSCELTKSPLSDVPVSEPDVIRVIAEADRDISSSNANASLLRVTLYDKHEEFIELKKGSVAVNGLPMSYLMLGEYERNDVVQPDYDYTFTVTLSDGSNYSCHVHTPKNLYQMTVPSTYDRKSALTITWGDADPQAQGTLSFYGDTTSASVNVPSGQGSVTVQPSSLAGLHSGQTLRVELEYKRKGTVDVGFMSTSIAGAWFTITRSMKI